MDELKLLRSAPVKILLVDDLKDNLLALEGLLLSDELEILKAQSGTEALEFMINNEFALALIDVQMPDMSGFELAEFMRGTNKTRSIPIIFVSATAKEQSYSFKGYESGAVDFLLKPLNVHAVKSKVQVFVELHRHQSAQEKLLTKLRKLTGELGLAKADAEQAKDVAEKANEFKSAFLANISHEIRTPLAAILGFAELLRNPQLAAEKKAEFIDTICRNGNSLAVIINDVLDLSKVEAGHLRLELMQSSPRAVAEEVVKFLSESAGKKGLSLSCTFDLSTPVSISSDPTRLRQILLNLIGNAIKFTSDGSVKIHGYGEKGKNGRGKLCFEITDTGIGIAEDQKENIFEMFVQADETVTRMFGGSGLGLALARNLARALGGDISVLKTELGKGSTFLFYQMDQVLALDAEVLPQVSRLETAIEYSEKALAGLHLLIVDDTPDNRSLFSHYLAQFGATFETAENGELGLQKAMTKKYDMVLMDVQMRHMDGYTATRKLRSNGYLVPIVALTAHALSEIKKKCLEAGYSDHLSKPTTAGELIDMVLKWVRPQIKNNEPREFLVSEEMLQVYLERRTVDLGLLLQGIKKNTVADFNRIGHQLMGNAKSYGFSGIEPLAFKMEKLLLCDLAVTGPLITDEFSMWLESALSRAR